MSGSDLEMTCVGRFNLLVLPGVVLGTKAAAFLAATSSRHTKLKVAAIGNFILNNYRGVCELLRYFE